MKNSLSFIMPAWPLITVLILVFILSSVANARVSPKLGVFQGVTSLHSENNDAVGEQYLAEGDFKAYYYKQTLDHFNYRPDSYATFKQKYMINNKYWGGKYENAPIFVYLGDEAPLGNSYRYVGFMSENAERFRALLVYIEHRYYGESIPFRSREEAFSNASTLGYFSSAQAIADYAAILIHIKKTLRARYSPVIAVGGSYGGMLASWFRLKYPHVVLGALASSAPILYFDDITPNDGYFTVATRDFQEESQSCYETIKESWDEMDRIASLPDGLSILSQTFNTCSPLSDVDQLKDRLVGIYSAAAQYSSPLVTLLCQGIDGAPQGSDILTRIHEGIVTAYQGRFTCFPVTFDGAKSETYEGWSWQTCTEMVMPIGRGNETMFFPSPFNLTEFNQQCKKSYGVEPRSHWATTYYGGRDIKLVLERFGSNIIFSNGLKDPYSSGGVLEDLSKSLVAITTEKGTHCMDILNSNPTDPKWLVKQREEEVKIIKGWLNKYYKDL
uniref:Lysosomal Pro-X carboxypeptidase n=1 Tax=Kalanchoe fedtschenkoi TaxID=63787 RepID=A0A7N0UJG6_KALFE